VSAEADGRLTTAWLATARGELCRNGRQQQRTAAHQQLSVCDAPYTSLDPDASPKQRLHHLQGAVF